MELDALLGRIETYRRRYGREFDFREPHLLITIKRLTTQIEALEHRRIELTDQIEETAVTVRKMIQAVEFELEAAIAEIRRTQVEMWSPTPISGYRAWAITEDGMRGVWTLWKRPVLTARCANQFADPDGEVPHTDERCGRLGCGIYATKDLQALLDSELGATLGRSFAVGRVHLTGKVVEHEYGYRAAVAEATAVVAFHGDRTLLADDPAAIAGLFADPTATMAEGRPFFGDYRTAVLSAFAEGDPWTSERRSA